MKIVVVMDFELCWLTPPGQGGTLEGRYTQWQSIWENVSFSGKKSVVTSLWEFVSPPSQYWDVVCFESVIGLLHAVSLRVHVYQSCFVQKMLFPWRHLIPLTLKIHLLPSLQRFLSLNRRRLIKISHVGWVLQSFSASARCRVVSLWDN